MTSLTEKVKDKCEHGTILHQAPKHSSASMGAVERARWEIQAQTRTMKSQVAGAYQIAELGHARPIFPGIVRRASWFMARFLVRATGTTAYAAVYGEEYHRELTFGRATRSTFQLRSHG